MVTHLLYLHDTEYETRDDRPALGNTLWQIGEVFNFHSRLKTPREGLLGTWYRCRRRF